METSDGIKSNAPMEILFVDDEKNVLHSLRRLFMDEDYEVLIANSGEEALDILQVNPNIGLIVSDQRMPGLTGVDFLEKAKEIVPDALRILLTGYADINAVADAINRGGAYRYVTKPWKDEELLQVISEAVQHYSLRKENKRLNEIVKRQNLELKNWNSQLEFFVQEQTLEIQKKNKELEVLNESLKKTFKNSIRAFSSLLELRDRKTGSHSKNVADLSVKIARGMNLPEKDMETITVAALLHDIGKIGIPDAMLLRDFDDMDKDAKNEYMQHPVRGQAAIDSVEDLRPAGVLIRHHHEWFNGHGYPDGRAGDKIPLGARIIAVADFVDNSMRGLEGEGAFETVLGKVRDGLGSRFDYQLYLHVEREIRNIYTVALPKSRGRIIEVELNIKDVKEGMMLARDVKSGTGLILLSRGTILNTKSISGLRRYYQLDPSQTGVFVALER